MNQLIIDAINSLKKLSFAYHGNYKIVEPHTYGLDKNNEERLSAYQVEGDSESGKPIGWKFFKVDEIESLEILSEEFSGPEMGYKRGDSRIARIIAEL